MDNWGPFLLFIFIVVIVTGTGAMMIVFLGLMLQAWILRKTSLGTVLSAANAIIILIFMSLTPTRFSPEDKAYCLVYFLVPGLPIAILGIILADSFWPSLEARMSYSTASFLDFVLIPGGVCLVLGCLQWYLIGKFWEQYRPLRMIFNKLESITTNYLQSEKSDPKK